VFFNLEFDFSGKVAHDGSILAADMELELAWTDACSERGMSAFYLLIVVEFVSVMLDFCSHQAVFWSVHFPNLIQLHCNDILVCLRPKNIYTFRFSNLTTN